MKGALERIYFNLPVAMQNMVVSLYGYHLATLQRGRLYRNYLEQISCNLELDRDALHSRQLASLKQLVASCASTVPYYRDVFKHYCVTPDKIKTLDDLNRIPLLDKEALRKDSRAFVSDQYNFRRLHSINTSGTTGTPLKIYFNRAARQLNYAFYDRFLSMAGIDPDGKKATFGGRLIVSPDQKEPPFWRFNHFQKNLMLSTYHMRPENLYAYCRQLNAWAPAFIEAYPSTISELAIFMKNNTIDGKKLTEAIVTSAETLMPHQRSAIESAFGVPVVDQYGSAEMAAFAGQCKHGRYHVHMDFGITEFLRPDGTPAKPGEEAEIVCTGFVNKVMPLVRYRIGDRCIYSDEPCGCGLQFPVLDKLLGRMDDVIRTPDGRAISRFGAVLYGMPVKQVQYVQPDIGELIVKIIKDNGFTQETEIRITNQLRKRLGHEIKIEYQYVDAIDRSAGGKLKTIISKL